MPQQSILPDYPPMTAFAVQIRSFPHTAYPDQVDVAIQVGTGESQLKTRQVVTLRGVECDFLDTLVTECTSAYMYGETPQDVAKAASAVKSQARAHGAMHQF